MKIYAKQIDSASLTEFVTGAAGQSLSGQLNSYLQNGGYLGVNVVYASGGFQIISGSKRFETSPQVPYSGGTGEVTSRLYIDSQIATNISILSGINTANSTNISGKLFETGSILIQRNLDTSGELSNRLYLTGTALSAVRATGSLAIQNPNFSGVGGTIVFRSGDFILISGGAAGSSSNSDGINLSGKLFETGAALSSLRVTGSNNIQIPNLTGMGGTLIIQSGNFVLISGGAGGGGTNLSVTGSAAMATPNFTGMGGILLIQSGNFVLVSGGAGGATFVESNTFNFTGTGTNYVTTVSSGATYNTYNVNSGIFNNNPLILNGITGNFVNMSFYFDESNLITGLNLIETFITRDFIFTGYGLGLINSGIAGFISGSLYQRNTINTKTKFLDFSFNSGQVWYASGGYYQIISGMNRVGVDIVRLSTGCTGFTVGTFGVGY